MKPQSAFLKYLLVLTFVLLALPLSADEAPAPLGAVKPPPVSVKIDAKATETHIQISREALKQLLNLKENHGDGSVGFISSPDRTLGAGLAMSLALVLGGLYLARKRGGRAVLSPMAMLAIIGVLCAGSVALADKAPTVPPVSPAVPADRSVANPANSSIVVSDRDAAEFTINPMILRLVKRRLTPKGN